MAVETVRPHVLHSSVAEVISTGNSVCKPMTLQDSGGSSPQCRGGAAGGSSSGSSCEPAPTLLQLSANDLQHLILQVGQGQVSGGSSSSPAPPPPSAGLVSTSPFMHRSPLITQEQEGFAAGFIKALADLHKHNQLLGAASHYPCSLPPPPDHPSLCGGETAPGSGAAELDEPQTVPETPLPGDTSSSSSPPSSSSSQALSCIDHEAQERLKAERKRLKNRIAASRCRRRKLERITRLEERVRALKGQNVELAATAGVLREQVAQLRQKVLSHVTSGCHIPDGGSTTSTC